VNIRLCCLIIALLCTPGAVSAYPLDSGEESGITRLKGYQAAQLKGGENRLAAGALLPASQIQLHPQLLNADPLARVDPALTESIIKVLGKDADDYAVSLLDLSDPSAPRYAEWNGGVERNPGSVGKLIVALSLFQTLADIYPDDRAARQRILRETMVTADSFILHDDHKVPFWLAEQGKLQKRAITIGDRTNLMGWLDWMLSASSNAAAAMVFKQVMLLNHFGREYPVSAERERDYFDATPKSKLGASLMATLRGAVERNGLDPDALMQGGFFTREGKRRAPGGGSRCTTRGLMQFLVQMERGALVDSWSSLAIKKLMYMTEKRIRYASSPALANAALYFKSGSFYKCRPEAGFSCKKYAGNELNVMNSVAVVEHPASAPRLFYMVALTSNVLRKNSAVEHQTLATRLHRIIEAGHPAQAAGNE